MSQQPDSDFLPAIRRVRFDKLTIYEVSDSELDQIERGSPDSLLLTFSIFFISTGVSFLITLITTPIESVRVFTVFTVVATIGLAGGTILLALWRWHSAANSTIIRQSRDRNLPDVQQNLTIDQ